MKRILACAALALLAGALHSAADSRTDHAERVPEARAMVQLRDRWFILNPAGRGAVDFYYRYSPYAAFAIEQDGRDRLKVLAGSGIAGLRLLFRGALLWMPAAGALIVLWLAALLSALLRRVPRVGPWLDARRHRLLAAAVAVFLLALAADWLRPAEVDKRARIAAIRAAFERGDFPPDLVASATRDPDSDVRYEIVYALAEYPAPGDRPVFRAALADPDLRVRSWALNGIGNTADREAVPDVVRLLADPVYNIRYRAAWALGAVGDPSARPALERLLAQDEHVYVRYYAASALDRLAGEERK